MAEYTLWDIAVIFLGSFTVVFLLGLQSRNVNAGRYVASVLTSAGISLSQFIFVKYASSGSYIALGVSTLGGCMGIASAIWTYQRAVERRLEAQARRLAQEETR